MPGNLESSSLLLTLLSVEQRNTADVDLPGVQQDHCRVVRYPKLRDMVLLWCCYGVVMVLVLP